MRVLDPHVASNSATVNPSTHFRVNSLVIATKPIGSDVFMPGLHSSHAHKHQYLEHRVAYAFTCPILLVAGRVFARQTRALSTHVSPCVLHRKSGSNHTYFAVSLSLDYLSPAIALCHRSLPCQSASLSSSLPLSLSFIVSFCLTFFIAVFLSLSLSLSLSHSPRLD